MVDSWLLGNNGSSLLSLATTTADTSERSIKKKTIF